MYVSAFYSFSLCRESNVWFSILLCVSVIYSPLPCSGSSKTLNGNGHFSFPFEIFTGVIVSVSSRRLKFCLYLVLPGSFLEKKACWVQWIDEPLHLCLFSCLHKDCTLVHGHLHVSMQIYLCTHSASCSSVSMMSISGCMYGHVLRDFFFAVFATHTHNSSPHGNQLRKQHSVSSSFSPLPKLTNHSALLRARPSQTQYYYQPHTPGRSPCVSVSRAVGEGTQSVYCFSVLQLLILSEQLLYFFHSCTSVMYTGK